MKFLGKDTKPMHEETFKIIHDSLQRALNDPQTKTLLDALENFRETLSSSAKDVPEEDLPTFYRFTDGLRASYYYRWKQSEFSNFVSNVTITLSYMTAWYNETHHLEGDFGTEEELTGRIKSVISDLRKILEKSLETDIRHQIRSTRAIYDLSSTVRDRLGLRMVTSSDNIDVLFERFEQILDIFGGHNPQTKKEFVQWYEERNDIPPSHKRAIREILDTPFGVSQYKNYVDFKKKNGYESIQFTMTVQSYSSNVPGLQFEIQLRTKSMDDKAVFGSAAHPLYKRNRIVNKVISIDDPTVTLRIKKGLEDFIPLSHCRVHGNTVEVI